MLSLVDEIVAAEREFESVSPDAWYDRLEDEQERLQAALRWLREHDAERGLQLVGVVWPYWVARGRLAEGRGWLEDLLARTSAEPLTVRVKVLYGAGILAFLQGDGDEARLFLDDCLAGARALRSRRLEADALIGLARLAIVDRDPRKMETRAWESAQAARAASDERRFATALHHVAEALRRQGRFDEALPLYAEAIERHRAAGDRRSVALELHNLGRATGQTGGLGLAAERFRKSLAIAAEIKHERLVGYCLLGLAALAAEEGAFTRAVRLLGASDALFAAIGAALDPEYADERKRTRQAAELALGKGACRREYEAGLALRLQQVVQEGLASA